MEKGGIFDNIIRTTINEYIIKNPGLHMSALSRKLNIPKSTMNYHLRCLIDDGYITQKKYGKYLRYYVKNTVGEHEKKLINLIRQHIPLRILLLLFLEPNVTQKQLGKYLDRHPTTISFHMEKLIEIGLIEGVSCGNHIKYQLINPSEISCLVMKYGELF